MKLLLRVWLPVLLAVGVLLVVLLAINWNTFTTAHRLSYLVAIAIILHMLEEERVPGGFGFVFNVARARSDAPDRYPMNPLIAMTVDVVMFVILFVPALVFPDVIWLALAPMFLTFSEALIHTAVGIIQFRRLGYPAYTPGQATAVFLLLPIGIWFIVTAASDGLLTGLDWLWGVLYFIAALLIGLVFPERFMASKTSPYAFTPDELLGHYYKRHTTIDEVLGTNNTAGTSTKDAI